MAPTEATCPHCRLEMDIPRNLRGVEIECPQCEKPFTPVGESPQAPVEDRIPKPETSPGRATCPACKLEMDVPSELQGQEVECPGCRTPFSHREYDDPLPRRRRRQRYEDEDEDDDYIVLTPEQRTKIATSRLKPAAICLMLCAFVQIVIAGVPAVGVNFDLFVNPKNFNNVVFAGVIALIFLKSTLTAFGAWKMYNARSYGWGLAAGILVMIPGVDICCLAICSVVTLPIGIWTLVMINDYDVRWLIRQQQKNESELDRHDS